MGGRGVPVVDYVVRVPYTSDAELRNVEGSLQVDQVQGALDLHTVSGATTLQDLGGRIAAAAVNGSIRAVRLEGTAKLETVNGGIGVEDCRLATLEAETVNGRITIQVSRSASEYTLNTINGGCHLAVPLDLNARVSVHGLNVKVHCAVPATSVEHHPGVWTGVLGSGSSPTAKVNIHTVNGQLDIDSSEPPAEQETEFVAKTAANAATPVETPEAGPDRPEASGAPPTGDTATETLKRGTQVEILERVESGELSVQDALALLEEARA